jgi:hypothetical protein
MQTKSRRVAPLLILLWTTAGGAAQAGGLKDLYPSLADQAETNVRLPINGSSFIAPGHFLSTFNSVAVLGQLNTEIADQFSYDAVSSTVAAFANKFDPHMNTGLSALLSDRGRATGEGKLDVALPYSWIDDHQLQGQRFNNYDLTRGGAAVIALTPMNVISGSIAWEKSGAFPHSQLWLPADDAPAVQNDRWIPGIPNQWHSGDLHARCGDPKRHARYQDRERDLHPVPNLWSERQSQRGTCGAISRALAQGERPGRRSDPPEHRAGVQTSGSAQSSSYGDLLLHAKTKLFDGEYGSLASRLDFYAPNGDADNLRSLAHPAAGASLTYSAALGHFSPHASVDLLWRFDAQPFEHFALGGDIQITPWLTTTADVSLDENTARYNAGNSLFSAATGIKVNPWRRVVLSTNVLWRFNDHGLRALANIGYTFR